MKKLIALTGKTGAGKSTVSKTLSEKGAYVIDGDVVARDILKIVPSLLDDIKNTFGENTVLNGELDRKELARIAFSTPENTEKLNRIFHPAINSEMERLANEAFKTNNIVIVDAAAIIESGFFRKCDMLITVTAPLETRLDRIIKRDNITKEEALRRINAQKEDAFYENKADIIINNGNSKEELQKDVNKAFNIIMKGDIYG